jgi:hypothetical protein
VHRAARARSEGEARGVGRGERREGQRVGGDDDDDESRLLARCALCCVFLRLVRAVKE